MKNTFTAGIDVGSATTKVVVLDRDRNILSSVVKSTGRNVLEAGTEVLDEALAGAGLVKGNIGSMVATGYGRHSVANAKAVPEIICHAMGAFTLYKDVRTVIDIGGQDSKVISVMGDGRVGEFVMNDKCAAGSGRFLELVARIFDMSLNEMSTLSLQSKKPCQVSSTCAVFAETELVGLRACGEKAEDLLAGVNRSLAYRLAVMGRAFGFNERIIFTGGVAYNSGVKKALQIELNKQIVVPPNPQIIGALGAAILALK